MVTLLWPQHWRIQGKRVAASQNPALVTGGAIARDKRVQEKTVSMGCHALCVGMPSWITLICTLLKRTWGLATQRGIDTPDVSCAKVTKSCILPCSRLVIRLDNLQVISIYCSYRIPGFTLSFLDMCILIIFTVQPIIISGPLTLLLIPSLTVSLVFHIFRMCVS